MDNNLPTLRHKKLDKQAKIMLLNVAKYLKMLKLAEAASQGTDLNVNLAISEATTVSVSTIKKVLSLSRSSQNLEEVIKSPPKKRKRNPKVQVDSYTEGVIRRKIHGYYAFKKEVPNIKTLAKELKDDGVLTCGREFLRKYLHRIGFEWKKLKPKRFLLMENMDIMHKRHMYLSKIKKHREEGRKIVYVDETYVNSANTVSKCWQSQKKKEIASAPRLIVVHAGGQEGLVDGSLLIFQSKSQSGDYRDDMNFQNFKKWTEEKLLPNLPPNATVVLANASYNNVETDKKPPKSALKQTMLHWLQRHNIDCNPNMLRSELYGLIQSTRVEKKIVIDEILKSHGHDVLRLPPYHGDLNPMELVWGHIKGQLASLDLTTNLSQKSEKLIQFFSEYSQAQCVEHVIKVEDEYLKNDIQIDNNYDDVYGPFISDLSNDTSSESSDIELSSSDEEDSD